MARINDPSRTNISTIADGDLLPIVDITDATLDKNITMAQIKTFSATDISGKQDLITTPVNNDVVLTDVNGQTKDSGVQLSAFTQQGNIFNGNSQLVQLTSAGKYPALDGSLITNIPVVIQNQPQYAVYSVNTAAVNVAGYADFISKIDNSSIRVLATTTPIILTYPDGSSETISSNYDITGISVDGTYTVVKEKSSNPVATTSIITESQVAPVAPTNGDYWLNIGVKPYQPYKRVGGAWVATQFVKLGQFTRTAGVIGTPISYALNGQFVSEEYGIALSTTYSLNHNIGSKLCLGQTYLVCKTAEGNYVAGEYVGQFSTDISGNDVNVPMNPTISTNILATVRIANQYINVINSSGGVTSVTLANWKLVSFINRNF